MTRAFFCVFLSFGSLQALAISGLQSAVGGSDSGACQGMGLDSNVGKWCGEVWKILNDPSTCAGEEAAKTVRLQNASLICPQAGDALTKEHWQAIIMSMISVESSGKCETTGDAGGKSQGLLQSTSGDRAPNPKSAQECTGDQKDCLVGLKCGMCLALSNANASGVLFEGGGNKGSEGVPMASADFVRRWFAAITALAVPQAHAAGAGANPGLAKMFGPWRPGNAAHSKQVKLAQEACKSARPGANGDSPDSSGPAAR